MKKFLTILILLSLFLVGCGKKYKTYTQKEKIEIIESGDIEKFSDIMEELEKAAGGGDIVAINEKEEWKKIYHEYVGNMGTETQ